MKKRKFSSIASDNISSSSSAQRKSKYQDISTYEDNVKSHGFDKKIIVINKRITDNEQSQFILYTATFPCRIKSFFWDLDFMNNKFVSTTEDTLNIGWAISKRNQGTNSSISIDDDTDFYKPEKDLITGGTEILQPATIKESISSTHENPLIYNVDITNTTPPSLVAGTTLGIVVGIDSGAFDGTFEGEVAGSIGNLSGTITADQKINLQYDRKPWISKKVKGSSNTYRDLMVGDHLIFNFIQSEESPQGTSVFGTIQFFINA